MLKCVGTHLTRECTKSQSDPVQCVNCGCPHSANYSNCKTYLLHLQKLDSKKAKVSLDRIPAGRARPLKPNPNFPPLRHKPLEVSIINGPTKHAWGVRTETPSRGGLANYAQGNSAERKQHSAADIVELITELRELNNICDIGKMVRLMRRLQNKLSSCKTDLDRLIVFSDLINDDRN